MTIVTRITFNTGRLYARDGQIITAELHDDGKVVFDDSSRMIWGEFQTKDSAFALKWWPDHPESFAKSVMHRYDHNDYNMGRGGLTREDTIHDWRM